MNDYLVQAAKDIEAAYQELKKARKEALDSGNQFQLLVLNEITTDLSHIRARLNQVTT